MNVQHLDKLIPLMALIGVGGILWYLLRLGRPEPAAPAPVPAPWSLPITAPVELPVAAPVAIEEPGQPAVAIAPLALPSTTPSAINVLSLLKSKDTLKTAFLLREILGPPVSRRRQR